LEYGIIGARKTSSKIASQKMQMIMICIRAERPDDIDTIRRLNEKAFGQPAEANIVD